MYIMTINFIAKMHPN